MNTIIRKKSAAAPTADYIKAISEELSIHPRLVELLAMRGIVGKEKILDFLHPDALRLSDPFIMTGMKEAAERIKQAVNDEEKIVVYGDYDADGVCASAILSLCFKSIGADVIVHIPDRIKDGYGLSVRSIEEIIETHMPDLIITCDCGISAISEVEHCKDLGVDIIVTDHHEPGQILPDCILVNPKQPGDKYPDKYLCGAGVALKLVQAITEGDFYKQFLDIAAVATIADLVPLLNENRLIVQLGLRNIAEGKYNYGLRLMLRSVGISGAISSTDIAYKIAPRINAAGRMGDAYRAFQILTSDDESQIKSLIAELDKDNERRKELCNNIYDEAVEDLAFEDMVNSRAIILCNPEWYKGVTGIAAARFTAEYHRPTFIIVDRNENGIYKGTARGISGINIFDALSYCSDLLVEFGGHTGAAGFSIAEDNIPLFRKRINEYMQNLPTEYFLPQAEYDIEVTESECNLTLLDSLELIEPTGHGNEKPLLKLSVDQVRIAPCKNPAHTSVQIGGLQTYAFNFYNKNQYLIGNGKKDIVLELTAGLNGGVSGYIKAVGSDDFTCNDEMAQANFIGLARYGSENVDYIEYKNGEISALISDNIYGTLCICADSNSFNRIMNSGARFITCDYMTKAEPNNYTGIIVAPNLESMSLAGYERIVFADKPPATGVIRYIKSTCNAEVYVPQDEDMSLYASLRTDREIFATVYSAVVAHAGLASSNLTVFYKKIRPHISDITAAQFIACLSVFCELGFFEFSENALKIKNGVRRPLSDSVFYRKLYSRR